MSKSPFGIENTVNRIKMHMLGNTLLHEKIILIEGPSDANFYRRMFTNTVHTRTMYSRERVVNACKLLQDELYPCYGIVDLDYYWFHSERDSEASNVLVLDENNLESFVLFDAPTFESWNHSGELEVLSNITQCAKLLGIFRCISHVFDKKWRFKPNGESNNSVYHLRPEIRRMFSINETRSPAVFLIDLLNLYEFSQSEFDVLETQILNSPNYNLSRLINGKDLDMFLSISNRPHVFKNAADGFELEQFRNSTLGIRLQPLGVLG
jgi:hypothetical protein